jgi:hydrogenase-4 component B
MINNSLFSGLIIFFLIGGILSIVFNKKDRLATYCSFLSASIASVFGIIFSIYVIFRENFSLSLSGPSFLNFGFFIDRLSAFFILVISVSVFAVSIYSIGYTREYYGRKNIGYLGFLYNIFILSMILVVSANNAIMFLIVWELMSVISFFLVIFEHEKAETRKAGFIYIVMTHVGTGFILLSFLILAGAGGSFSFESFSAYGSTMPPLLKDLAFLFALIGFGAKAGIVPLHIWLPYAHPAAPSNVSALMSGVMIKTAIYMFIRVFFDFLGADVPWWGFLVFALGAVSALTGIMYAVVEPDIKKMLAFSSIENIGIILLGIGTSMIFLASGSPELSAIAGIAALYHLLNHSVFKGLLFMGAGSILYSTHTKNIEELGGLIKNMPIMALLFLIGVLSISALPPFSGFVSEWLLLQSLLLSFTSTDSLVRIVLPVGAAALAITGSLAAFCFLKTFGIGFLALPRSRHAEIARDPNKPMLFGMGIFAFLSILLGLLPVYVVTFLDRIVRDFAGASVFDQPFLPGSSGTVTMPSTAMSMSTPAILAAILLFILILFAMSFIKNPGAQNVYETWGCGQPTSTARNEYTACAFSKPVQMWFKNIFRPVRELRASYTVSPLIKESFKFEVHIEQIFERYIYSPVSDAILGRSRNIKRIQTGSIHAYLSYIFGTMVILMLYIILGGS